MPAWLQVDVSMVDEPQLLSFKGTYKLAAEPRGTARSAALAAAETVLVRACLPNHLPFTCSMVEVVLSPNHQPLTCSTVVLSVT